MSQRILVIGAGSIGRRHLRIVRTLMPDANVRVLRHRDASVPEHADGVFMHLDDAVAFAPHIAVVAGPATFHLEQALALANAGVDLLVEKPLAASAEGVATLLQLCRERGCILQVAYNLRFLPSLVRFRELVCEGRVGRIISVRCEIGQYLPNWRPGTDYRSGVSAQRALGGGALLELSHEIDYLRWIFGEFDWIKATLGRQSNLEIDVEDSAHLTLGFMPAADDRQLIGTLNMDLIRHDTTRTCVAIGEEGSLRWDGISGRVDCLTFGQSEWQPLFQHPPQHDDSYFAEWRHFLDCVETRSAPLIGGADGLAALRLIDAARVAAALQASVRVSTATGAA